MSTVARTSVLIVTCPTCGAEGPGPEFITRDWDGQTYGFACGHEHHLHTAKGGARTRLVAKPSAENGGKQSRERE